MFKSHYSFADREKGGVEVKNDAGERKLVPLMNLSIGSVNASRKCHDIREVTEVAIKNRREAKPEIKKEPTQRKRFSWR